MTLAVQEVEDSPFLPNSNIQYAWDATSLELFKRCPRLYQYKMIDGWNTTEENVHLRFGGEFHMGLQDYENSIATGIPHDDAVFDVVRALLLRTDDWRPDHKYKNRPHLIRTVIAYLDKYQDDPATTMKMENGRPAIEVSFRFELDFGPTNSAQPYVICGHLDRVVEFGGAEFVMDRKTTTTTPSDWYWSTFDPNVQMTTYTLAAQIIFETPIKGVIIDSAQILIDGTRFTRGITYRNKDQLDEWVNDLKPWLTLAEAYATNGYWPMNDTACDKYGGCKFRGVCSKSPQVRDKFLKAEFKKEPIWNPLTPR